MRILIIEDEIKLARAVKKALETQMYAVDIASHGKDGLDMAVGENYDAIILDLLLPEIDGLTICKELRKLAISTPIIMLTAKGQIHDKIVGLDIGADDYMVKPFSFEELFARLRAIIRRPRNSHDTVLKIDDLSLDPQSFSVIRTGQKIHLSAKEFSILEYLLRNKNTVLTRDQIVSHVWNFDADILPSTVEVHMKHLRDKIDRNFSKHIIQTIRGRGYTISDE